MKNRFDELAKVIGGNLSRRQAIQRVAGITAAAVFSVFGLQAAQASQGQSCCACAQIFNYLLRNQCLRTCFACAGTCKGAVCQPPVPVCIPLRGACSPTNTNCCAGGVCGDERTKCCIPEGSNFPCTANADCCFNSCSGGRCGSN